MADARKRLPENVPGDFFVDASCIDCDACRQIAPSVFHDSGDQSAVFHQPASPGELLDAQKALVSCPTSSIGSIDRHDFRPAIAAFPEPVEEDVFRCGFTSQASFGAFSYFIERADGNVLVDSPRFAGPLVKSLAARGGAAAMLLTHADDVADHEKFHRRFGCQRVLHRADVRKGTTLVEEQPVGTGPLSLGRDIVMIPTPGHTRGHAVFLYRDRFLFTGDHLAWDEAGERLYAFRSACWYSWEEQTKSMRRLLDYSFDWVLPGHGRPVHLPASVMHRELERCVDWMMTR
jgi:glyoxylase-like metal-dependent hydrolase (beta-lactamase superfamily II)/ferredoxin